MGIVISYGIQKGGAGKTTLDAITAHLLSKEAKVLAIDFDSQGNLTEFLTRQDIYTFSGRTVLEAVKSGNPRPYIVPVTDTLHVLPAEDLLATFSRWLYREYKRDQSKALREMLEEVRNDYDYIIIDLPPNLGDQTINALTASDYAMVVLQSEPFCYSALERYLETLQVVKGTTNPRLNLLGVVIALSDSRAGIDNSIVEKAREEYGEIIFDAIIKRRSRIKEFSLEGIRDTTKADNEVLEQYRNLIKEMKQRVEGR